jgi:hypothetical protein
MGSLVPLMNQLEPEALKQFKSSDEIATIVQVVHAALDQPFVFER